MSKTDQQAKTWTKPELVKLGTLKDVAGNAAVNGDGNSKNLRDPAPS